MERISAILSDVVSKLTIIDGKHDQLAGQRERSETSTSRSPARTPSSQTQIDLGCKKGRSPRLEFPRFDGHNPKGWLFRANRFSISIN